MRVMSGAQRILGLVIVMMCAGGASAQQFAYPSKDQSPAQQKKDEAECGAWAAQQSKYDPAQPPSSTTASNPPTTATGITPGVGVRGAARGAVVGEIMGDAGAGAAAGAIAARGQSRRQNVAQQQQQQRDGTQQNHAGVAAYEKARAACLGGRGYFVK